MAPIGYDTKDRKISVNEAEADRVRTIFRRYLKLGSLNLLMTDLRKARHRHQDSQAEDRKEGRRHSVHARAACPSATQSILYWRGGI
jgi:hypothetical protein